MADVIKLRDWHTRRAEEVRALAAPMLSNNEAVAYFSEAEARHIETARILDLLARVRAEHVHKISQKLSWDGEQCALTIYGPTDLLRELAEAPAGEKP